ncbi:TadE family type IV pilus minor pilin [Actinoplanes sp. TFC3]|uniref:TadE family type IV pilus minor pilin n=1 Tax=Actinoplanes sp. TFC3 TaxID=1710355 RepID=UPI0008337D94|nr:TadE family type IV pilus minor pilin [Actinoplanes sp. TFC3]
MARRWFAAGRDRGAFTAELAVGLPVLMIFLLTGLTAVTAATARARCEDAAREGALLAARGGPAVERAAEIAPGAVVEVTSGELPADTVTVRVTVRVAVLGARLPALSVHADATAAREPGAVP